MNPTVCIDHRRGDFSQQTPKVTMTGRFTSAGTDPSVFLLFLFLVFVLLNDDDCRLGLRFHSGGYLKDNIETLLELMKFIRMYKDYPSVSWLGWGCWGFGKSRSRSLGGDFGVISKPYSFTNCARSSADA